MTQGHTSGDDATSNVKPKVVYSKETLDWFDEQKRKAAEAEEIRKAAEERIVYPSKFEQLDRQRHRDMLVQARVKGVPPATGQAMSVLHKLASRLRDDLPLPLSVVVVEVEHRTTQTLPVVVVDVEHSTNQTLEDFLNQTIGNDRRPVPAELHAKVPDLGGATLSEFGPSLYAEARRRGLI